MIYVIFGAMTGVIVLLLVKLHLIKKSAREITSELGMILKEDTNTSLRLSTHDRDMCRLADSINVQLKQVRKEHLQYHQGNTELKTAITNISHDIRTPLTAIAGNLYMIGKTDDLSEIREYVGAIEERTEAMKQLTEELFRYCIIVSGDSEAVTEEVFVNQALQESISSFYPVLTEKGITPQIHITDTRIVRNVNRSDLEITLSDLGEITFSNTAKELSTVEVEQLFDRFYTVEVARNSTGLGLSIARTLVERMGGTITAEYDDGRLTIRIML